jgi:hypothetical protein
MAMPLANGTAQLLAMQSLDSMMEPRLVRMLAKKLVLSWVPQLAA